MFLENFGHTCIYFLKIYEIREKILNPANATLCNLLRKTRPYLLPFAQNTIPSTTVNMLVKPWGLSTLNHFKENLILFLR